MLSAKGTVDDNSNNVMLVWIKLFLLILSNFIIPLEGDGPCTVELLFTVTGPPRYNETASLIGLLPSHMYFDLTVPDQLKAKSVDQHIPPSHQRGTPGS